MQGGTAVPDTTQLQGKHRRSSGCVSFFLQATIGRALEEMESAAV